jgi:methionyl-tRNA formyltransferase
MKVSIISGEIYNALGIYKLIDNNSSLQVWIHVSKKKKLHLITFLAYLAYQFIIKLSLKDKAKFVDLFYKKKLIITQSVLHSPQNLKLIKSYNFDVGIHNKNVIYKKELIDLFNLGILNAHIGKLPEFRGRSVMQWSLLYNVPTGISTFFIDDGIDTGNRIVRWKEYDVSQCSNIAKAKNKLFSFRKYEYSYALKEILNNSKYIVNDLSQGKRYYEMSKLFSKVVENYFVK